MAYRSRRGSTRRNSYTRTTRRSGYRSYRGSARPARRRASPARARSSAGGVMKLVLEVQQASPASRPELLGMKPQSGNPKAKL